MLRTMIASAGAGLLLTLGSAVPVAGVSYVNWGSTSASDQVLKPGCHNYHYRFQIEPPTDNWAAETFLIGPHGAKISSGALISASDPSPGRAVFRLCRPSLIAGTYKIRMKITYKNNYDKYEGFVKPSHFRLVHHR